MQRAARGAACGICLALSVARRWGDRQHTADRLDPRTGPDGRRCTTPSRLHAPAVERRPGKIRGRRFQNLVVRFSSRFSHSRATSRSRSTRRQARSLAGVARRCSITSRMARSRTYGENRRGRSIDRILRSMRSPTTSVRFMCRRKSCVPKSYVPKFLCPEVLVSRSLVSLNLVSLNLVSRNLVSLICVALPKN